MSEIISHNLPTDMINESNKLDVMHHLASLSGYEEKVPTVEQFIMDPYYLGKTLGDSLYPIWMDAMKKLYPTPYYSPYDEVVLSGAIGLGKSTAALLITLYDACRVLSLKNPHEFYNLIDSTIISFALMNATKGLAGSVLYGQIIEWIEASPYFKSKLSTQKHSRTLFIKNVDITMGSRGRDMLGQATIGALFSEVNDMTVVGDQAQDNFDTIATRRDSRFGGKGKQILGHLILDSSNKGSKSFIEVRIEEKRKKNVEDYILFAYTHWAAKWHLGGYSGEMFQVYAGDENRDPFIITEESKELLTTLNPGRFVDVPVEHRQQFEVNIIKSLRDLAGVSTYSTFSFLSSNEIINKVFDRINIVTKPVIILDFFDPNQTLEQFIDIPLLTFLSNKPRFIHIDLGLKYDSTGMACSYLDGYTDSSKFDPLTGKTIINREPVFVTEWIMEIRAIPGQEVAIWKIKEFILSAKRLGYPIHTVSTDGFQSSNLRQDLTLKGIKTALISVDRTKDPYYYLRNCMLEARMHAPNIEKLVKEIKELEEHDDKFDHPSIGSKDLTDALCGSIWSCSQNIANSGTMIDAKTITSTLDTFLTHNGGSSESRFEKILTSNLFKG